MFTQAMMIFLYTESPLHVGSGRDMGVVDLPIQRDKVTQYPIVQSSSLKGKLRAELREKKKWYDDKGKDAKELEALFGKAGGDNENWAGAVSPGDARILLFPVRSLNGVFAWVTSLDVLTRFRRDVALVGQTVAWQLPDNAVDRDTCWVANGTAVQSGNRVTLEEFTYDAQTNDFVKTLADWLAKHALPQTAEYKFWREKLAQHLVILPDDDFRDFALYSTEVNTRVKLVPETKTVQSGALWTEENLPSDSLLYTPLALGASREYRNGGTDPQFTAEQVADTLREAFHEQRFQLGGNETTGRGYVMANIFAGGAK
jgi:CRISPR-associated protein Cmr4